MQNNNYKTEKVNTKQRVSGNDKWKDRKLVEYDRWVMMLCRDKIVTLTEENRYSVWPL